MSDRDKNWAKPKKTIEEHVHDLLEQLERLRKYGYIQDENIYRLCKEACKAHDLGKKNKLFQQRVTSKTKIRFNPEQEVPHNILSGYMLDEKDFQEARDYLLVLYAVLYHHDYVDVSRYIQEEGELIEQTLQQMGIDTRISRRALRQVSGVIEDEDGIRIKGILHKCDYSASAELVCEHPADFLLEGLEKFLMKLKAQDNTIDWNEMQQYCRNNREENIMIVAQTGMGKTEGALNWIGNHKGFFVLPLRTAINAMYQRIKEEILDNQEMSKRLAILHSASLAYYVQQASTQEEQEELLEYEKNGKQWAMPLSITTMDQLFDFVFKYQGYELKLATLGYSKIVVDEIQMYSPDLLAYLIYGLERIHQIGGKIAIITATLPPFIEELLCKKIRFKPKEVYYQDETVRHFVKVKEERMNIQEIYDQFTTNHKLGKSNKILVICNTIKKAREVYSEIGEKLGKHQVKLLHSGFIRKDRKRLEDEIRLFGKTYNQNGKLDEQEGIWVSTSLVEASLDIDFDYLFTELQELSSLFQRLGRCNRKGKKQVLGPNCIVYTEIDQSIIINGDKGFIDGKLYELSKAAIQGIDGLLKESKKMTLMHETLTRNNLKGSHYMKSYEEAYGLIEAIRPYEYEQVDVKLRHIFTEEIIPSPIYEKHQEEIDKLIEALNQSVKMNYEKIRLEEQLMAYTVAIPQYEVRKYVTAVVKNKAEACPTLKYDHNKIIKIIDCEYDERGFVPKAYVLQSGEGEFL